MTMPTTTAGLAPFDDFFSGTVAETDPDLAAALSLELKRQQDQIELIASENIVSRAVLEAQGSVLTNKYAEGYPGRRYYGGCEMVDIAERLAIERACKLYGCSFANVQPHSGAQANQAVFLALLKPGDTILGMSLAAGGHLTHGAPPNQSGKWFNALQYGVKRDDGLIDFDQVEALAREHKPKLIIAGGSAYPRVIDFARFRAIADEVGAWFLVDMAHFSGLVAGGAYPSPLPHAHVVTTTTHKTLRGPRGGMVLSNDPEIGKKINSAVFPGLQGGPLMHVIAAKAVAFGEALRPEFRAYAEAVAEFTEELPESEEVTLTREPEEDEDGNLIDPDAEPEEYTEMRRNGLVASEFYFGGVQAMNEAAQRLASLGVEPLDPEIAAEMTGRDWTPSDEPPFQVVILPEGGDDLRTLAPVLIYQDIDPLLIKFVGTGLWRSEETTREPALANGWFAGPDPAARGRFETAYERLHGDEPSRVAGLGYDAASLAALFASEDDFSAARLTDPDGFVGALEDPEGFLGVDGLFRFRADGSVERGLAVYTVRSGSFEVLDPAPLEFPPELDPEDPDAMMGSGAIEPVEPGSARDLEETGSF